MNQNSIIVYRNPLEQQIWEGDIYGFPIPVAAIMFAIVVGVVFCIGNSIWWRFKGARRYFYNQKKRWL